MASEFSFFLSTNPSNSIETASTLANANDSEAAGSIALLSNEYNDGVSGFDAFGGKDIFGTPDCSSMYESFVASANNTETAGSLACVMDSGFTSSDCGSSAAVSVGGDCGGCSSAFTSVC